MTSGSDGVGENRENDSLVRALTSGFFATVLAACTLAIAYWLVSLLGNESAPPSSFARWCWALTHNAVTAAVETSLPMAILLHFMAGIGWAVVYALFVEPRLTGSGWRRGAIFSLAPWVLSLVVFLPLVGGGFLGLALGAGPLPIIGNLVLHLVYGVALGQLYLTESDRPIGEHEGGEVAELLALSSANRTMAAGIIVGLVLGAIVGLLVGIAFPGGIGTLVALLLGALVGSALGALAGSFWGLSPQER